MIENINWYPGHMKKTRELIQSNLKLVDVVIEVIDARIPISSRNPIIDELVGSKPRMVVLNKIDLADESANKLWLERFKKEGYMTATVNAMTGEGVAKLLSTLEDFQDRKNAELTKNNEQSRKRTIRLMVVGVPNVGKSSLINRLMGKKSAMTGDRPGVTKGKQWLTLKNGMQLLDTPGILWHKFEDAQVGINLAFCGSIKDETMDMETLALELVAELQEKYPEELKERYKLEELEEMPIENMDKIALKRGFIMSGKRIDYERTARTLLDEFRSGIIGKISLEK